MPSPRSPQKLLDLFEKMTVVDLPAIQDALGGLSVQSAFRYLKLVPYRRSYDHNGRFYTFYDPARFDRHGLWCYKDIHFSVDGSLKDTVRRLIHEASAGATHRELQQQLHLRVHNTLLELYRKNEVARELVESFFVYLHPENRVRQAQIQQRQKMLSAQQVEIEVTDAVVIEVLLVLIRHPGSGVGDVVRRLRGHSPPIRAEHVRNVFDRYDLEHLGEKGGP